MPDLNQITSAWGLELYHAEQIKDVYRIETNQGVKNLKVSPLNPKQLNFVHQAVLHLSQNGFQKMTPLIKTLTGNTYVDDGQFAYTLFNWIEGKQCRLRYPHELATATAILAEFHFCSQGFTPTSSTKLRSRVGKCPQNFEKRYQELLYYKKIAALTSSDRFAQLYLKNVDFYLPLAAQAMLQLKNTTYLELVDKNNLKKPLAHGDPAARNFIITPEKKIYMIDFDSCRLELPILDLIKFARRVLKKYHWKFEIFATMLQAYQTVQPLSSSELEVMKAVLYFPQKFWRMSNRYFEQHDQRSPERLTHKFEKLLKEKKNFAHFQIEFQKYR